MQCQALQRMGPAEHRVDAAGTCPALVRAPLCPTRMDTEVLAKSTPSSPCSTNKHPSQESI
jgi:hypothetical protein